MGQHLPVNPHYSESGPDGSATADGREVAHAVLALAYEQRTANLIAFHGDGQYSGANLIADEIAKRLGLRELAVERSAS